MPESEVDKLFKETGTEPDIMNQPLDVAPEKESKEMAETHDDELGEAKRRREKRLMDRLQAERESSIALAAKLEALTEAQKLQRETEPSEYLKKVERIYGNDSPEATAATQLLADALKGVEESATQRALEKFREEQSNQRNLEQKYSNQVAEMLEEIEDTYDVDLTSDNTEKLQEQFRNFWARLSPKDEDGRIEAFADPLATWELFQEKIQSSKGDSRQKSLASRAIAHSGSSNDSQLNDDAARRLLKEAGII